MKMFMASGLVLLLMAAVPLKAAVPVEREVQSVRSVQVYSGAGQRTARPIGAIDFSAGAETSWRLGPWDLDTDAFEEADGVIFYDDGSAGTRGSRGQYQRPDGSRCEILGNVTVCR